MRGGHLPHSRARHREQPALRLALALPCRCIFEVFVTLRAAAQLTIATSQAEAAALADVREYERAIVTLGGIDSRAARATHTADKARIDAAIVATGGFEQIDVAVRQL